MASFGRSCEKLASAVASFAEGVNQRLDENHIVDMMVALHDEEIEVSKFADFTETIQLLRSGSGRKVGKTTSTTTNS